MSQVSNVCKRASWQVGVISRIRNMIPRKAKLQIFKSAILPHLTYCQTVWHFCCSIIWPSRKVERSREEDCVQQFTARKAPHMKNFTHSQTTNSKKPSSTGNCNNYVQGQKQHISYLHSKPVYHKHQALCWKFGALFAGDIKLITTDLFLGAHQFILSLHVDSIYVSTKTTAKF